MSGDIRSIGLIIEQEGKILVECRNEYGEFSPGSLSLPFFLTESKLSDPEVIEDFIYKQYDGHILELKEVSESHLKSCLGASCVFYHVTLKKSIKTNSVYCRGWLSPQTFMKKSYGVFPKVVETFFANEIEVVY